MCNRRVKAVKKTATRKREMVRLRRSWKILKKAAISRKCAIVSTPATCARPCTPHKRKTRALHRALARFVRPRPPARAGLRLRQSGGSFEPRVCHRARPVFMRVGNRAALADRRWQIRHGLSPHPGDVAGDLRGCLHEEVAQGAGDLDIVRSQRDAHPLLGVVVMVDRVVAPPGAVVVPNVVVGIGIFIFHAPMATQGVGHPLSYGANLWWFSRPRGPGKNQAHCGDLRPSSSVAMARGGPPAQAVRAIQL